MSRAVRAVRLVVTGRVQGVGYRAWATRVAAGLGLRGWVRNRRHGSVELLAIGDEPAVAAMIAACREGPPGASVTAVDTADAEAEECRGFAVRPTL
ncbi:MAG TPA: acylphosphatase [Stellaceae bacterium]|jgi:acylphosphatase